MPSEWLTLKELAAYSRLSERQLKRAAARDFNRLPSHLIEGRRLFLRDEYNTWATSRKTRVEEIKADIRAKYRV